MEPEPFKINGPLPGTGITVLEASAGTGKTHTVAALATRFVAEGVVDLDALLVITFSRAATQELRDRVRLAFVQAAVTLADPERARSSESPEIRVLTEDEDGNALSAVEIGVRRRRLLDAIANYDAATIATTHEFCNAVLRSLGVAGDSDSGEVLREDIGDLRDEVVDDQYLARFADLTTDPPIEYRPARNAARQAVDNRHASLRPLDSEDPSAAAMVGFVDAVRTEIDHRKRTSRIFTFDDMLSRLASAVAPEGSAAAERMRSRWGVVLVDEFQDTDPVQWAVLRDAFAARTRLVLIGDPKQAIYAFRGGDTPTYLEAVKGRPTWTLAKNYRSDPAVVRALQVLTRRAELGDSQISVHPIIADREGSSLSVGGGVRLRQVRRDGFSLTKSGTINIGKVRDHIARDLAADIARQLNEQPVLSNLPGQPPRPLDAGDIAILLHSVKDDAPRIKAELSKRGIPSVINAAESVMTSPAAGHWMRLLAALEKPQLTGRIRAAALTPFFSTTADDLLTDDGDLTDQLAERVRSWLDLLRSRGVAAVHSAALAGGMAARVLALDSGERLLTDLTHVGQLLHRAGNEQRLGVAGLVVWLREAIEEGNRNDARRRRLDVDAKAVQFVTIHGSKGLEYPVVYLPQLFDRAVKDWPTVHAYHEDGVRCLDIADSPSAKAAARREEAQEELRLAYVALTRARSQVTAWWAPTYNAPNGSLTRLLFGRVADEPGVGDRAAFGASDDEVDEVLGRWAALEAFRLEPSVIGKEKVDLSTSFPALDSREFARELDTAWRRTSYSGLIRADEASGPVAQSEPEHRGVDDELAADADDSATDLILPTEIDDSLISPMDGLTAGATFGSLVHAVLEHTDPKAPDLRAELLARVEEERRWWSVPASSEDLADAMVPMQHTPMGPLADNLTLAEIGLEDRLRELDFEFPMGGGDVAGSGPSVPLGAFAAALRRHLPSDDPIFRYAAKLEDSVLGEQLLRGYLSGSIDVVLRVRGGTGDRYVVVDYKTNTLGEPGRSLTALDYTPAKVADAMLHSHYPLQALLYSVVLHRYLRWRLPDYDPEVHLGGVLYLYLRGMVGAHTPVVDGVPCGVFSWKPPAALVLELSALLDGHSIGGHSRDGEAR